MNFREDFLERKKKYHCALAASISMQKRCRLCKKQITYPSHFDRKNIIQNQSHPKKSNNVPSRVCERMSCEQYTRSLASVDFSGAVFTCAHFQKIAQISILCDFHYISEGIPSPMHFCLLIPSVLRIWFLRIFARLKQMHRWYLL